MYYDCYWGKIKNRLWGGLCTSYRFSLWLSVSLSHTGFSTTHTRRTPIDCSNNGDPDWPFMKCKYWLWRRAREWEFLLEQEAESRLFWEALLSLGRQKEQSGFLFICLFVVFPVLRWDCSRPRIWPRIWPNQLALGLILCLTKNHAGQTPTFLPWVSDHSHVLPPLGSTDDDFISKG